MDANPRRDFGMGALSAWRLQRPAGASTNGRTHGRSTNSPWPETSRSWCCHTVDRLVEKTWTYGGSVLACRSTRNARNVLQITRSFEPLGLPKVLWRSLGH